MKSIDKFDIELEVRAVRDQLESGAISTEQAKAKTVEIRNKKAEYEKAEALAAAPKAETGKMDVRSMVEQLEEKRAITLSGTGAEQLVSDIMAAAQVKVPLLSKVSYINSKTVGVKIPVFGSPVLDKVNTIAEGGTLAENLFSTNTLAVKEIETKPIIAVLPVTLDTLKFSWTNIESKLPQMFADTFNGYLHQKLIDGVIASSNYFGLFSASAAAFNELVCAATGLPKVKDFIELALQVQQYVGSEAATIVTSPAVYSNLLADTTTTYDPIRLELATNRTILGVPVVITGYAPSAVTTGSILAVAGNLSDYTVGIAENVTLKTFERVGDMNQYIQGTLYCGSNIAVPANFTALKAK